MRFMDGGRRQKQQKQRYTPTNIFVHFILENHNKLYNILRNIIKILNCIYLIPIQK